MKSVAPLAERTLWFRKRLKSLSDPDAAGSLVNFVTEGYNASEEIDGSGANGTALWIKAEYENDDGSWSIATFFIDGVATLMSQVYLTVHPDDVTYPTVAVLTFNWPNTPGVIYRLTVTFEKDNYEDRETWVGYYQVQD